MKVKLTWELEDLKMGMYIIRESFKKNGDNWSFAMSVAYQIGWKGQSKNQRYYLVAMSDGMIWQECATKKAVLEMLNSDTEGYRPLTTKEHIAIIVHKGTL